MIGVASSTQVDATPAEVWAVLSDFGSIATWAPNADHSCLLSRQLRGVGTVRRIQAGRFTLVETVTEWEPPLDDGVAAAGRLAYAIEGLPPVLKSVFNEWRVEPRSGGVQVTLTSRVDAGARPPQQLVAKIAARRLGSASDQMLNGLGEYLRRSPARQRNGV